MPNILTEDEIEQLALQTLQEQGYEIISGASLERAYNEVILTSRLVKALARLNPNVPEEIREEAIRSPSRLPATSLIAGNEAFHKLLTEGIDVKGGDEGGEIKTFKVWLVGFEHPEHNIYCENKRGEKFIVELQKAKQNFLRTG